MHELIGRTELLETKDGERLLVKDRGHGYRARPRGQERHRPVVDSVMMLD